MDKQEELVWGMREILMDWLIHVHFSFQLLPETLFHAVNIIDRFLSARPVSCSRLELIGITSLFIASKVEEIYSPSVSHFLYSTSNLSTENEIFRAERIVLKVLDWNLSYPNPLHFLRRLSGEYDAQASAIAKFLLEVAFLDWRLLSAPPSLTAAAAIWLARLTLDRETWVSSMQICVMQ